MDIIDFEVKYKNPYFMCLEEWSEEMNDAGNHREVWYEKMKNKGLKVKLAKDDNDRIIGMIQYLPAELSFITGGEGYYFVKCIWVHGYNKGVGNQQKKGVGTKLLEAAELDCKEMNVKGLLAWGVSLPFWMKVSWFVKHGYVKIDKDEMRVLVLKSFTNLEDNPKLIKKRKDFLIGEEKPEIMIFKSGWCAANNIVLERTLRAIKEFKDLVNVTILDTTDPLVLGEWGVYEGVFINGKTIQKGPPPSYEKIYKKINREVKNCR